MFPDFLRQIVSGPKIRYQEDGYNLDLTYITPRIIAMAYPAQGFQKLYRNSIDSVAQLLEKNHGKNYQIINVSGREIKSQKLSNIEFYYWEDHKTPQFQTLFRICDVMLKHLQSSPQKVSVVHCNHGKGRTGTLICCFLLFIGYYQTTQEVLRFYSKKRFEMDGYGVTQPCQIKYIQYFEQFMKGYKKYPNVISVTKIRVQGQHHLKNPYFKLLKSERSQKANQKSSQRILFTTKGTEAPVCQISKQFEQIIQLQQLKYFVGDCILQIKHEPILGKNLASSYVFNTGFVNTQTRTVQINVNQLSPLSSVKSGNFGKDFKIVIHFKKICQCRSQVQFQDRCQKCREYLKTQKTQWDSINKIIKSIPKLNPILFLHGNTLIKEIKDDNFEKGRNTC